MPSSAAIYCRISSDPRGLKAGVERQEKECRELAEAKGWKVAQVFVDNDVSASKRKKRRPAYEEMLQAIRQKRVDAVVTWAQDRLVRQPAQLEEFFTVCEEAGLTQMATVTGTIDLGTRTGKLIARNLGAAAAYEIENLRDRLQSQRQEKFDKGIPHISGLRPFGFEEDRISVRWAEAELIRDAADKILRGVPIKAVCKAWNEAGHRTPTGREWYGTGLRKLLQSPRMMGLMQHRGETRPAPWPAILDEQTYTDLQVLFSDPSRRKNGGQVHRYLLTRFVLCGREDCGERLISRPSGKKGTSYRRNYICDGTTDHPGCGRLSVAADPLEEYVAQALNRHVLESEQSPSAGDGAGELANEEAIRLALAEDEDLLRGFARDVATRMITRDEYLVIREVVDKRIKGYKEELARVTQQRTQTVSWAEMRERAKPDIPFVEWTREPENFAYMRNALAEYVEKIYIFPGNASRGGRGGNTFNPERVKIVWRA